MAKQKRIVQNGYEIRGQQGHRPIQVNCSLSWLLLELQTQDPNDDPQGQEE